MIGESLSFFQVLTHDNKVINNYESKLEKIFKTIKKFEKSGVDINEYLEGPTSHSGFKRLN